MFLNLQEVNARLNPIDDVINIRDFLPTLGVNVGDLILGDFDFIGEYTAKKLRDRNSKDFKSGAFFRPNYERGILIYHLIKHHNLDSMLEIGYGRGYACLCAARAFHEMGHGTITTVDPALNENQIQQLASIFPSEWFSRINFVQGTSDQFFSENDKTYDLVYIDGDHRKDAVSRDWKNSESCFSKFVLFDDYFLPTKTAKDIEVGSVVDEIEGYDKRLIITDRRIFHDDRGIADSDIDYGQVIVTKK